MNLCRRTASTTGTPTWMPLLFLLACALLNSVTSEVASASSEIDASGEIKDVMAESKLSADGTNDNSDKKNPLDLANAQIDWLISKGGKFNRERIAIRPVPIIGDCEGENECTSANSMKIDVELGIFATNDIARGDDLLRIPTSTFLTSESTTTTCEAALTLLRHVMKKGNSSDFAPYLNYLYSSEEFPSIPSTWSAAGKSLLKTIQGPSLIPQDISELSFFEDCIDEEDEEDEEDKNRRMLKELGEEGKQMFEKAYTIALTRSWDEKMIPVLDMFNHHPVFNIATKLEKDDDDVPLAIIIFALKNIRKGQQLYTTYRKRNRNFHHHVASILQNYGIVEDYPQQWRVPTPLRRSNIEANKIPPDITFDVIEIKDEFEERYQIRWISPGKSLAHPIAAEYLKEELTRIKALNDSVLETAGTVASRSERETILDYYESLVIAYETVVSSVEEAVELSPGPVENAGDSFMACSDFEALHDGTFGWELHSSARSGHQGIDFYYNEEKRDACLFLEEYLHACVSNRPHYHEVFVHYPANYLEKVERVLFIGGGDSMVLHEVLKYEDELELVVGLELDQKVVRQTFAKVGTQPHFDNDKVEWWFGDAAKTLNILPTEYYGTFDLVVVDILSEVAESLKVTENVTIMEAAMMLMKPTGIIVKNEDEGYVPGSTNSTQFTDYTIDVMYYDVPVYCLQTFVIGSNAVDFANAKPVDHNLSNFYLKGANEFRGQFDTWYTSGKEIEGNENEGKEKKDETKYGMEEEDDDSSQAINKSGLTMIIEAEQISVPISMASDIQQMILKGAKKVGFTAKKSFEVDVVGGYNLVSVLEEGVVTARCFPAKKYCAIDVQLWKSVHVAELMKTELLSGLGSEENSVFRVITTGIYGVEENDNNHKIGPPSEKTGATTSGSSTPNDDESCESEIASGIHTTFTKRKDPKIDFKNATMEDYDSVSALAQWHSQDPTGHQAIVKYELPFEYEKDVLRKMLVGITEDSLHETLEEFVDSSEAQIKVVVFELGDGFVLVATWSEGSIVGVWDGYNNYDMNIFSLERSSRASQSGLGGELVQYLKPVGTDMFPRGTGRVINFRQEFMSRSSDKRLNPFWAPDSETNGDDAE